MTLIFLFFTVHGKEDKKKECDFFRPCTRICCQNKDTCSVNFFRENFNESLLETIVDYYDFEDDTQDYNHTKETKVLLGKPDCSLKLSGTPLSEVEFYAVCFPSDSDYVCCSCKQEN